MLQNPERTYQQRYIMFLIDTAYLSLIAGTGDMMGA